MVYDNMCLNDQKDACFSGYIHWEMMFGNVKHNLGVLYSIFKYRMLNISISTMTIVTMNRIWNRETIWHWSFTHYYNGLPIHFVVCVNFYTHFGSIWVRIILKSLWILIELLDRGSHSFFLAFENHVSQEFS